MIARRVFLPTLGVALLVAPRASRSQPPKRTARVGWVAIRQGRTSAFLEAFRQGMREHGWVEGQNLTIDARWVERAEPERFAEAAAALVRLNVDVIVTQGSAVHSVKSAAGPVPIVFSFSGDPVEARLVASLALPGGSVTGMTFLALELAGKRLELLKEAVPAITRVAILANPQHPGEQA